MTYQYLELESVNLRGISWRGGWQCKLDTYSINMLVAAQMLCQISTVFLENCDGVYFRHLRLNVSFSLMALYM